MICNIRSRGAKYQYLEVVKRNRTKRTKYGRIYVEGVIPVNCALTASLKIEVIAYRRNAPLSDWARNVLARCPDADRYELTGELMEELSDKENPSELVVIAEQPDLTLSLLSPRSGMRTLILDRPSNPGNLGAVVRSADSFGIDAVIVSGHSSDLFDPRTISASRGTVFTLPAYRAASNKQLERFFCACRDVDAGYRLYGSSARGEEIACGLDTASSWSLVIGNETDGMNAWFRDHADRILTIPMHGTASSLNMACAATVILFALMKKR